MVWLRTSLVVQVVLALYFQAIIWFPLRSWNDQPGHRLIMLVQNGQAAPAVAFAFAMLLPVMLFAFALWRRWFWLMWLGLIGYGTWAALQFQSWWIPWIFGADERALKNAKFLERTYKLFSSSPTHPAPDAMHFVLDLLLFVSVATIAIGLLSIKKSTQTKRC